MKFQIMSDLHQEFYKHNILSKQHVKGDVLLLAGDVTAGARSVHYIDEFGVPVFYVLGNHEHYGRNWKDCIEEYRCMFQYDNCNIKMLENDTVMLDNGRVRLIGCSLWTDFLAPLPPNTESMFGNDSRVEHQGFFCKEMMSDFYEIKGITISGWEERYKQSVDYLRLILGTKHNGPTIVMTHHAPSFQSSHPKYNNSAIKGGFCSNLEWLIEEYQPELWIHGHCHESFDYTVGNTRVLCNPRGYHKENQDGFNQHLIVEL